ncbi:MAG: hypothetical protein HC903_26705 [Methylacidiphilales bacterium]|nr:hypothetical protein [Candidatus Methylacidiphilales bacterium]NJR15541.1 hypothetical protein [Calothrix sp. CSU_2_0]
MKNLLFYALSVGLIISIWSGLSNGFSYSQQSASIDSSVNSSGNNDMQSFTSIQTNQRSQSSSTIQESSFSLSSANLNQPQTLKISSSGTELKGEISIDGKVVQHLNRNQFEINLSPYLLAGKRKVEIKANYTPASANVSVEMNGSGNHISQQTSGNGTLNYTLNVTVQ